jgi:hypothetical protein
MKDHINEITKRIKSASEEEIPRLIKLQDEAIQTLIDHVIEFTTSSFATAH